MLREDDRGHYRTEARVDGMKVEFLVDTGATAVMLSVSTAAKLGIRPAQSEYTAKVMTGNGEIRAAVVQLNKIELGDITVRDVRALVYSDEKAGIDLLGMTFLSRVRWTHDRGRLIIEQQSNN
jgi:aspartyl protease family protein